MSYVYKFYGFTTTLNGYHNALVHFESISDILSSTLVSDS